MKSHEWIETLPGSVMVCDADGVFIEMNDEAARLLEKHGGRALLGSNIFDCHPEGAREKLRRLMRNRETNIYTTEKHGIKRLVWQFPWFRDGKFAGLVELSFEVPAEIHNFRGE